MKVVAEPVEMIARFSSSGENGAERGPVPCKFRYRDVAEILREIRVDKVLNTELTAFGGVRSYIYRCQSVVEETEKIYELKYVIPDCRWELYKI